MLSFQLWEVLLEAVPSLKKENSLSPNCFVTSEFVVMTTYDVIIYEKFALCQIAIASDIYVFRIFVCATH